MMPTDGYLRGQRKWLGENNIKPGTKVLITKRAKSRESGWENSWASEMDFAVGQVGTVVESHETAGVGVLIEKISHHVYNFPYFVLETWSAPVEYPPRLYRLIEMEDEG